jgi:hypothetical protein
MYLVIKMIRYNEKNKEERIKKREKEKEIRTGRTVDIYVYIFLIYISLYISQSFCICMMGQQMLHTFWMVGVYGFMQRGPTLLVIHLRLCSMLQQQFNHQIIAQLTGLVKRRRQILHI